MTSMRPIETWMVGAGFAGLSAARRLSQLQPDAKITVLEAGRIVEAGSHGELLACGGPYAKLYALQFADSQPAPAEAAS